MKHLPPPPYSHEHPKRLKNAGFTLIELLVVVLIVGILAAIAWPQYQKAIIKSRFAEAMTNLKPLQEAFDRCGLTHGTDEHGYYDNYCHNMNNWDIDLPGEPKVYGGQVQAIWTKHFIYKFAIANGNTINRIAAVYIPFDFALCKLNSGKIVGNTNAGGCSDGTPPSFDIYKMLGIEHWEDCTAC